MYRFWLTFPPVTNKNLIKAVKKIARNLLYEINKVIFQKDAGENGVKYEPQKVPHNDLDLAEKWRKK